jgi:hypothetical protein
MGRTKVRIALPLNFDILLDVLRMRLILSVRLAHLQQLGRRENKQRKDEVKRRLAEQQAKTEFLFRSMGVDRKELGAAKFNPKL